MHFNKFEKSGVVNLWKPATVYVKQHNYNFDIVNIKTDALSLASFSDKETGVHIHLIALEMCYVPMGRTAQILTMSCFP